MGKIITHNFYTNIVKPRAGPPLTFGHSQILRFPVAAATAAITPRIFAKFENDQFDHLHVITGLNRSGKFMASANNVVRVYLISNSDQWSETFLGEYVTAGEGSIFRYEVPAAALAGFDADGELTLKITSRFDRLGKVFEDFVYINHIGIYPSFIFLKNAVEYLEISKVDE